jgi:protein-S-isoprenylcysteine O-methyltransferase Ste14
MKKETLKEEGLVREILKKGDLTAKEIKEELWRRNVSWVSSYNRRVSTPLFYPLIILWLLPAIAKWTGWGFLSFFAWLPSVDFPIVVIIVGVALFFPAFFLVILVHSMRRRLGGCNDYDETVVIIKKGPYGIIRHPEWLGRIISMPLLPIVLSKWIPYTIFAISFSVITTGTIIYYISEEDVLNIRKWGDEYRQYMKEAPAINFVKGLWSAMKKQREDR